VFVSRGLLAKLGTEAELAALLAHLAAHINAQHSEELTDPRLLTLVARQMTRTAEAGAGRPATPPIEVLVSAWIDVRYTPAMEAEADRLGMDYLAATGYNPLSMVRLVEVFRTMAGAGAEDCRAMHPSSDVRLGELQGVLVRKYPDYGGRESRAEYQREVLERLKP
jgi:predicted Zn-dependent protease